jgi:hypothetical protein
LGKLLKSALLSFFSRLVLTRSDVNSELELVEGF